MTIVFKAKDGTIFERIENIDCKDCKALGIYDNCNNNISECENWELAE